MLKKTALFLVLNISFLFAYSQINTITTAVPFLLINDNAQSSGMGDLGVVSSPFYYHTATTQNPALLARNEKIIGGNICYVPWLRQLVPDMNLIAANFYTSLDSNNTLAISGTYSNIREDIFYSLGNFRPYEYSTSLKYAHSFSKHFSMGIGAKFIYSNLTFGQMVGGAETKPGIAFAGDIGLDYRNTFLLSEKKHFRYDVGFSVLNVGNKMSYSSTPRLDFLPTIAKIGAMGSWKIQTRDNRYFYFDIGYQAEKLLVPTPPSYNYNNQIIAGMDPNVGVFQGMMQSFYDAPGGANEEFNEINHIIGMEQRILFDEKLFVAFRQGFFYEHKNKGYRQYATLGSGVGYRGFMLDLSYIIPTMARHPLQSTLRITVGVKFNLNKNKKFQFDS